jgi:hypothetical protein
VRLCGDYKVTVNKALLTEYFPMPTPEQVFSTMANGVKFSKIDLRSAYQQMLLDDESQRLVTINTHKGLFRYTRLPYGIASGPAIWQRFVEQVLAGLPFTSVIMDDLLVSGCNDAEHLKNVEAVLMRFRKFGLHVKTEKCAFMQNEVTYMGRIISSDGIRPTADKVAGIQNACEPRNVTELRAWLGLVNFHAQFIPHLSTRTHALNALLGKTPWKWSNACRKEFQDVKDAISEKALLTHYDPKRPVKIMTDASPYGVAAVLIQEKPVAYASRTLNEHERNYSQLDKEALGIIFALQKFHMYLYGRHFTILTDNKPVKHIMGPESSIPKLAAQRLQRWALILAAYDYDLQYVSSKQNLLADALSRLPDPVTETEESSLYHVEEARLESLPINSKDIGTATVRDPILSQVL